MSNTWNTLFPSFFLSSRSLVFFAIAVAFFSTSSNFVGPESLSTESNASSYAFRMPSIPCTYIERNIQRAHSNNTCGRMKHTLSVFFALFAVPHLLRDFGHSLQHFLGLSMVLNTSSEAFTMPSRLCTYIESNIQRAHSNYIFDHMKHALFIRFPLFAVPRFLCDFCCFLQHFLG